MELLEENPDQSAPGKGKLVQLHKKALKELKESLKREVSKAKSKAEKQEIEEDYKVREERLRQEQQDELRVSKSEPHLDTLDAVSNCLVQTSIEAHGEKKAPTFYQKKKVSVREERRMKKEQALLNKRQEVIDASEGQVDKGRVELAALTNWLREEDLCVEDIPADGHCLYRAVSAQLGHLGGDGEYQTYDQLRHATAEYLRKHEDSLGVFLDEKWTASEKGFEEYCRAICETNKWGGELELRILSEILDRQIIVFTADCKSLVYGEDKQNDPPLRLTFHRHLLALGAHYNSVRECSTTV